MSENGKNKLKRRHNEAQKRYHEKQQNKGNSNTTYSYTPQSIDKAVKRAMNALSDSPNKRRPFW